jgi:hypothetical protein
MARYHAVVASRSTAGQTSGYLAASSNAAAPSHGAAGGRPAVTGFEQAADAALKCSNTPGRTKSWG